MSQQRAINKNRAEHVRGRSGGDSLDLHRHVTRDCHPDHLKVFASGEDADAWFKDHDPEGAAFEYPVIGKEAAN